MVSLVELMSEDVELPVELPVDPAKVYVVMSQSERGQLLRESVGKPPLLSLNQARVAPGSQEKTTFVVPHGLYKFRVIPFGLSNAPAVLQRLMQRVLMGINPEDGQAFVSVYIDDILFSSRSLEKHITHLRFVLERITSAGLKLKLSKCAFVCQ